MTDDEELLVTDWFRRVRESQRVHYECGTRYSRLNYLFGIPTIILTAAVGTVVFSNFDKLSAGSARVALGLVSITATVLASLHTFLSFGERADRHRVTGSRYGALRRSLEFLKTFPPQNGEGLKRELERIKKEMDDVAQHAPHVPSRLKRKIDAQLKIQGHRRVFYLPARPGGKPTDTGSQPPAGRMSRNVDTPADTETVKGRD